VPTPPPRRPNVRPRRWWLAIVLAALAVVAASCGNTNSSSGASGGASSGTPAESLTVAIGFSEEVDPDVYFNLESTSITAAMYEGLLRIKPGEAEFEGVLAESWSVSDDGLVFTFKLRPGITFADGSPIDSAAVLAAFERKKDVAGPPSYILDGIAGYETPDPATFVVELEAPINNFLNRMASPWGSLITNPAVIAANASGGDFAKGWLGTHSAGSGPYVMKEFVPDDRVVLEANTNYWGTKPVFSTVVFKVIPDTVSQQLQVEQGDVDVMASVGPDAGAQIEAQGKVDLTALQGYNQLFYQVNVTKPPFDDPAAAMALAQSVPYAQISSTIFGKYGVPATQMTPPGVMPAGTAVWKPAADPEAFKQATESMSKDEPITMAQPTPDAANIFARTNEFVAEILRGAGYTVTMVPLPGADYFGLIGDPTKAPALTLTNQPGDGTAPANWFDLFYLSAGALNVGGVGNDTIDGLLAAAGARPASQPADTATYSQAAAAMAATGGILPIADPKQLYVSGKGITGLKMQVVSPPSFWVSEIKKG